jgi:hypothetical protein
MEGAHRLHQNGVLQCGKVPYRFTGGFWSMRRILTFGRGLGSVSRSVRRYKQYKHKGFEHLSPSFETHQRKRKKEGLNLIFGAVRPGCTGSSLTGNERFRAVSERVQLQK